MNKKSYIMLSIALVLSIWGQTGSGDDIILGVKGKTKHQIVIPNKIENKALASKVDNAAKLMKKAFAVNGVDISIVKESQKDKTMHGIYLGATEFAKNNGVDAPNLPGATYVHKAVGKDLIICGADREEPLSCRGEKIEPGTLFSVGEFLYRYVGARYLAPQPDGMEFLPQNIIHVPSDLNTDQEPFIKEHLLWASYSGDFYLLQHADSWRKIKSGAHGIIYLITYEKYAKTHPEYFALQNGVRQVKLGKPKYPQICYSNPDVREMLYQSFLDSFDKGYDIVSDGQPDGYSPCQCDECRKLYGIEPTTTPIDGISYLNDPAWGEKLWIMHKEMAERLMKDRPGKKLMIISYGPTVKPPKTFDEFPPNVIIRLAYCCPEHILERWKDIKVPGGFAIYYYPFNSGRSFGHHLPLVTNKSIGRDMEFFKKINARIINIDTQPSYNDLFNIDGPAIYAYFRLGIDMNGKNSLELFDEYIDAAYLEAAEPMRKYHHKLQERLDGRRSLSDYMHPAPLGCDALFIQGAFWPVEYIIGLDKSLTQAEKIAVTPRVKSRLEKVRENFDYLKNISIVIHKYRSFLLDQTQESLDAVIAALETRNRHVETMLDSTIKSKERENSKHARLLSSNRLLEEEPFNWNIEKIKKEGLCALKPAKLEIARTTKRPTLDSPVWDKVKPTYFAESKKFAKGLLLVKTSFKLLYDNKNLYVRVSGELPDYGIKFLKRGRDAELWKQDCVVVNLSPEFDKQRYFYFTYDPVEDSFVDAKHGYIRDYKHPRFGWNDDTWNGDWSYETKIDKANKRWESMAVFPFATLETGTPKPGEKWFANFGRAHRGPNIKHNQVWTGILNMSQIPGDASMGTIIFK